MDDRVSALAVLPNGDLVAGGNFTTAGGVGASRVARWDGVQWSDIGGGIATNLSLNPHVYAVAALPNGDVIVGGEFLSAGPDGAVLTSNIARWDGTSWSSLAGGVDGDVYALQTTSSGDVIASGSFLNAGGSVSAAHVARWNALGWSRFGNGTDGPVYAIAIKANGDIVVGGLFTAAGAGNAAFNNLARWNGLSWNPLGSGTSGVARALTVRPNGDIVVGGGFLTAGGRAANSVARWNGSDWSTMGSGVLGNSGTVLALAAIDNGNVFVGGDFAFTGEVASQPFADYTFGKVKPVVATQPVGGLVCANGTKELSVTLVPDNYGAVTYQWLRYSNATFMFIPLAQGLTDSGSVISGEQTPTLSLSHFQPDDFGPYYCKITGDCGPTSSSVVTVGTAVTYHAERARQMLQNVTDGSHQGSGARFYLAVVGDSNQFQTPNNPEDGTPGAPDKTGGNWEGVSQALERRIPRWGLALMNQCGGSYSSPNSYAYVPGNEPDMALDPTGSTLAGSSFDPSNVAWAGYLAYVPESITVPSGISGSTSGAIQQANPYHGLGDLNTTPVKLAYSYYLNPGATLNIAVRLSATYSVLNSATHTTLAGAWVDALLSVPPNASALQREVQFYNIATFPVGTSTGQLYISGLQWLAGDVTASSGTTGFAVGPLFAAGGYTGTQFNAELAYSGQGALDEYMRTAFRLSDYVVMWYNFMGNDASQAGPHNSFRPNDVGVQHASPASVSGTGPDQATPAGFQQNFATFCERCETACVNNGKPLSKLLIVCAGYHPQAGPLYQVQPAMEMAARDYADTGAHGSRVVVIHGSLLTSPDEMTALRWNNTLPYTPGTFDPAHLSVAGFEGFNERQIAAFFNDVNTTSSDIIATQPVGGTVCSYGTAMLSIALAPGTSGSLSFQWRRSTNAEPAFVPVSDGPTGTGSVASGAQSNMLTLSNFQAADSGQYYCAVSGDCVAATSSPATVRTCVADFNCDGAVNLSDIFDFLSAFFTSDPRADTNGVNGIGVQDIFDFLSAWFTGCP